MNLPFTVNIRNMRFMQDLPPIQTRQKMEQVKAYFSAVENPNNPLHEAVKDTKGCRLGRAKSWMGPTEDSILQVCQLTELKQTESGKGSGDPGVSVRHSCQKTSESVVENGQQAKRSQKSNFSFNKTANRKTS